jgi:hypothetical protein
VIHSNGSLTIPNTSLFDNGAYVCVAQNHAGSRRSLPAHLTIFEPPKFTLEPKSNTLVALNAHLELRCEASGFPRPTIEWKRSNSESSGADAASLSERATIRQAGALLVIERVQFEDEGEYLCVAENQMGLVEQRAWVGVYEKPSFVRRMPNVTVGVENKPLTIECSARGSFT